MSDRSGIGLAQAPDQVEVALPAVGAPHRPQHPRAARLGGQVQVLADLGALGHRGDHVGLHVLGMGRGVAHPPDALDARDGPQELGERRPLGARQVAAVRVHVLAEERHLDDPLRRQGRDLAHHVGHRAAALPPAHARHDAVGADAVAADGDLHPGLVRPLPLGGQAAAEGPVEAEGPDGVDALAGHQLAEPRHLARAEGDVDEGEVAEDRLLLALRPAPADGHDRLRALALDALGVAQVAEEALVRAAADRARVEEDQIRLVAPLRLGVPQRLEQPLHALGVVVVHLAPEGRQVVAHRRDPSRWARSRRTRIRRRPPPTRGSARATRSPGAGRPLRPSRAGRG